MNLYECAHDALLIGVVYSVIIVRRQENRGLSGRALTLEQERFVEFEECIGSLFKSLFRPRFEPVNGHTVDEGGVCPDTLSEGVAQWTHGQDDAYIAFELVGELLETRVYTLCLDVVRLVII